MNKAQQKRFNSLYQKHVSALISYAENLEPGVIFVNEVCNYYRQYQYKTLVKGANYLEKHWICCLSTGSYE